MPGKINPVIPEVVNQVAFNAIGNDTTIALAAEAGQLELNAFLPIIFYNLFQSIDTLGFAVETFADNCITGITANEERCRKLVESSVGIVTTLAAVVGYDKATDIAKKALIQDRPVREIILGEGLLDEDEVTRLLDPARMTGIGSEDRN
jgi:aspartate ammonia-lyase